MSNLKRISFLAALLFFALACGSFTATPAPVAPEAPPTSPAETPAAPLIAEDLSADPSLTICLGQEPNSLYPYGELNPAARSVLAAVYDDPYDVLDYEYQPGLLKDVPSIAGGDAQIVRSQVEPGATVVDASGNLIKLATGANIRPAGCRADDCVITYDGVSALEMDQMVVDFRMREDLTWSDGTPVTADDSAYAFTLASAPEAEASAYLIQRTQIYETTDTYATQWWGIPGFIDSAYETNFFAPAPKHLWSKFPVEQMGEIDIASRSPVGWGAYAIREWVAGDHIKLEKNRYYFRAGYPKFEGLTFRFIADPNTALSELVAGRCDILDPSIRLDSQLALLMEMQKAEEANYFAAPGMTIEWLGLGITPASYDDGYNIGSQKDRQDIFGDAHTRQGIVYCLDRQSVVDTVLLGLTTVPTTYVPVKHPLYDTNVADIRFDPAVGASLLQQAGWRDTDGKPETPLVAVTVKNVAPGTPLQLNYYTTTSTQRRQVANLIEASLAQCGIGLNVKYFSQNELYAPGPGGYLFGRNFDLIEYAMGVDGIVPPCQWFASSEIPTADNLWIGTNLTGYKNPEYDVACRKGQLALRDEPAYAEAYRETQVIFGDELPAIPLYYRLRVAAARPDLCGFELNSTANPLWNIESYEIGEACKR